MNKLTAIGALAFACAPHTAYAGSIELSDWTSWHSVVVVVILLCELFFIYDKYFSESSVAQKYFIRRTIKKHPELRVRIEEHLKENVLTRGDVAGMKSAIAVASHMATLAQEDEENRQKQLRLLDKDR